LHDGYSLHGLRKNSTIELLKAGCTYDDIKAVTGHGTTAMIKLYGKDIEKNVRRRLQSQNLTSQKNKR
tara:strand:+ start:1195 stop:1398 length:204 start_codon:yes stop_codon:yes gene_type:complete